MTPAGAGVRVPISDAYKSTVLQRTANFIDSPQFGAIMSDPTKMAERIVKAVDGTGIMASRKLGLRIPLGRDAGDGVGQRAALWSDLSENAKDVWVSV
ncbi:hypothetical protein F5X99DRAFT_395800 [Biscogniauxia marginata]|nr:hypothetical protein F5X99DRAFT_395800 [Biscogniauxia marginata]